MFWPDPQPQPRMIYAKQKEKEPTIISIYTYVYTCNISMTTAVGVGIRGLIITTVIDGKCATKCEEFSWRNRIAQHRTANSHRVGFSNIEILLEICFGDAVGASGIPMQFEVKRIPSFGVFARLTSCSGNLSARISFVGSRPAMPWGMLGRCTRIRCIE